MQNKKLKCVLNYQIDDLLLSVYNELKDKNLLRLKRNVKDESNTIDVIKTLVHYAVLHRIASVTMNETNNHKDYVFLQKNLFKDKIEDHEEYINKLVFKLLNNIENFYVIETVLDEECEWMEYLVHTQVVGSFIIVYFEVLKDHRISEWEKLKANGDLDFIRKAERDEKNNIIIQSNDASVQQKSLHS